MKQALFTIIFLVSTTILIACNGAYGKTPDNSSDEYETLDRIFSDENSAMLLKEDFEGEITDLSLSGGCHIIETTNGMKLEGEGSGWAIFGDEAWTNYTLDFLFEAFSGTMHINLMRQDDTGDRYFIGICENEIYLSRQNGEVISDLAYVPYDMKSGEHIMSVAVDEGLISISIDQKTYIVYDDPQPLIHGKLAFELFEESYYLINDIEVTKTDTHKQHTLISTGSDVPIIPEHIDETHRGDLIIAGSTEMVIEDSVYRQLGNVYIKDNARLIISQATFVLGRGDVPTVHTYFFVEPNAKLVIDDSAIINDQSEEMGALIIIRNNGTVEIDNSDTKIHLIENNQNANLSIINSKIVNPIGGLVQVHGGEANIKDSTIGALALEIPENCELNLSAISSGTYFKNWDVHEWIPEANYDVNIANTLLIADNLIPGPYERGILFFPENDSKVNIKGAELRKVFINIIDRQDVFLKNLQIGKPVNLKFDDINLENIIMTGQWPFVIVNSEVTISGSEFLFIQPEGESQLTLIDSHVVEFIPREFTGSIHFDNCLWTNAGEFIGGESFHSNFNDFIITGSLKISDEVADHLQWQNAKVTREFLIVAEDENGNPIDNIRYRFEEEEYRADPAGIANISIAFDAENYKTPQTIYVYQDDELFDAIEIDFFTDTPILVVWGK